MRPSRFKSQATKRNVFNNATGLRIAAVLVSVVADGLHPSCSEVEKRPGGPSVVEKFFDFCEQFHHFF